MTKKELEKKLKAEIGYKTTCPKCVNCGKCDVLLKLAIEEYNQVSSKPCESCKL